MVLKGGLQENAFLFSLEKTYMKSFTKILTRVEKYANAEETYDVHPIPTEAKADQKPEASRQAPTK